MPKGVWNRPRERKSIDERFHALVAPMMDDRGVNPRHLEAVTQRENVMRTESTATIHSRKTACPRGHAYDIIGRDRRCRVCRNDLQRERYAKYFKGPGAKAKREAGLKRLGLKIAIVSAGSPDYMDLAEVTQPTRAAYAKKHGYSCYFFEVPKALGDACKRQCYEALWGKGYDLFVWMDLDSIIWNSTLKIEGILGRWMMRAVEHDSLPEYTHHFLWGWDHAGPNSGVYFARFTSQARQFLDRAYATMLECGWGDETAMEQVMMIRGIGEYAATCPGYVLNAYDPNLYYGSRYSHRINQLGDDSLVLHMPGYPNEKRIPELQRRAAEAKAKWG